MTLLLAAAIAVPPAAGGSGDSDGVTTRVSVKTGGGQAETLVPAAATFPAVSADGAFVAFVSDANNLVADDTNGLPDVFVFDANAKTTVRASTGPSGAQSDGASSGPVMSTNGQYVAFVSEATNLVADDTNGVSDVFVYDRVAGTTTRVSLTTDGAQANGPSNQVALDGLGAFLAFTSEATNLVAGDDNNASDVFVRSRTGTGGTVLISAAASGGGPGDDASFDPDISDGDDGDNVVAFASDASDLVSGDTNGVTDVFTKGRTNTVGMLRVSVPDGATTEQANDGAFAPSISSNGMAVAFDSAADNLVDGDTNNTSDVFVRDVNPTTPLTVRVSVSDGGNEAHGYSYAPKISADGDKVAFLSEAADLLPSTDDTNAVADVFLHDRDAVGVGGVTARISVEDAVGDEIQLTAPTLEFAVDPAATTVAFSNGPLDPSTGLAGPGAEVIYRNVSGTPPSARASDPGSGEALAPATSVFPAMSADGRFVAFSSSAGDLVPNDTNGKNDVFVHDRQTGTTTRVSVGANGAEADGHSLSFPFLSADGRFVAFSSDATNLVASDTNLASDAFVHDRQTGLTSLVSVGPNGAEADQGSYLPYISADGRYVTFESDATNLVSPPEEKGVRDVYVHDREAGTTTRVSTGASGAEADQESTAPSISGDGRYVAFTSQASNLVSPADTNGRRDVFVRDRQAGTTTRVSVGPNGVPADKDSDYPIITPDGRWITFASAATNLVPGDTNRQFDVFLHDRVNSVTERVSLGPGGVQGNRPSRNPWVSADGRYVAFESEASNLVGDDTNGKIDAFVRDRAPGTTTRVSAAPGAQPSGESLFPTLSADGRYVTFLSRASNLVTGDTNTAVDVFVHDRLPARGYWVVASDGGIFNYGNAGFAGSAGGLKLNKPVVGAAANVTGGGYWLVATDGGIFNYGDAGFFGSAGGLTLNHPIVGMAVHPGGGGYWLVARDGGIFNYGSAGFAGSAGALKLNQPIVGMAPTPGGKGYWLVASDGGIFAYGDAVFLGSTGAMKLNQPIVGMAPTPSGKGYWLVARDGGIFSYGDARFVGSSGAIRLNQPIVGMLATPGGGGYSLVASDGGVFSYGEAPFLGSTGAMRLNKPIVAMIGRR